MSDDKFLDETGSDVDLDDKDLEDDLAPDDLVIDDDLAPDELAVDDLAVDDDLDDDLVGEEVLVEAVLDGEVVELDLANEVFVDPAAVAKTSGNAPSAKRSDEDDEEVVDLDEELHPDDVETPLDALLKEKTASAKMEDDEEELEEEEPEGTELGDGPSRIVPRRPTEFHCSSCFLLLPRSQLADEERMLCRDCA